MLGISRYIKEAQKILISHQRTMPPKGNPVSVNSFRVERGGKWRNVTVGARYNQVMLR